MIESRIKYFYFDRKKVESKPHAFGLETYWWHFEMIKVFRQWLDGLVSLYISSSSELEEMRMESNFKA